MTIQTTATLFNKCVGLGIGGYSGCDASYTRRAVAAMALIADHWRPRFQQVVGSCTVRHVAVATVIIDRLVVVHERPAFFHVARVAGFNNAIAFHQFGAGRSVHIVAIGTAHFAFHYRMVRLLVDLRALLFVAGKTNIGLRASVPHFIKSCMYLVA